ncbi:hypothetical protein SH668x_001874 [Planctomicrobium sp. SH668]|uniref:hypothetical protein n=1 Tax=Planctomicrobium sp. SH668 TaxID=3448126 RepID=UPI003F5C9ABB
MILPSLKKHRITQRNTLRLMADSQPRFAIRPLVTQIRSWGAGCAIAAMLASSLWATEPVAAKRSPLDRLKDRSAAQRWKETRQQYLKNGATSQAPAAAPFPAAASPFPAATDVASSMPDLDAIGTPEPLDLPLSGFSTSRPEPLPSTRIPLPTINKTVPEPYPIQTAERIPPAPVSASQRLVPVPELPPKGIAQGDSPLLTAPIPPGPIPSETVPQASPLFPDEIEFQPTQRDTRFSSSSDFESVFRPVSQIKPTYAYSPSGEETGKYLCPQPSAIPDDQRARCPDFQTLPSTGSIDRQFSMIDYQWMPTNLKHKPLYFEDVALERYGQQYPCGIQPFVSIGRFAVQGFGLPYQMAIDPVWRDIYPLGYYRPGDKAPELENQVPINLQAAAVTGGVYTGLIFLVP